jgi:hypothetical protein
MIDTASFNSDTFRMSQLSRDAVVNIRLCLVDPKMPITGAFPISGFPRPIILDELPTCKFNDREYVEKAVNSLRTRGKQWSWFRSRDF